MNRRILVLGEGATELRGPGDRYTGCARTLLTRIFGSPPAELLSFEEHVLSNFRRDPDLTGEPRVRGEDEQARLGRKLATVKAAHGLVLMRDNDRSGLRGQGDRRSAIERGFAEAHARGDVVPAVLGLAIECIEAWALADPDAWVRVFGKAPSLPPDPESLWGAVRAPSSLHPSNHPKSVLSRCLEEIGRTTQVNAAAMLLEHASLERVAATCPQGFGRFINDLSRAFPRIECIVAAANDRAIGIEGDLPWGAGTLRQHNVRLVELTSTAAGASNVVILGRRTWESLGKQWAQLRGCLPIVVSGSPELALAAPARRATSFDDALFQAVSANAARVFVLGGGALYREALGHFRCTTIHYTRVDADLPGDVRFPDFQASGAWTQAAAPTSHHDNGFDYRIERWQRFGP